MKPKLTRVCTWKVSFFFCPKKINPKKKLIYRAAWRHHHGGNEGIFRKSRSASVWCQNWYCCNRFLPFIDWFFKGDTRIKLYKDDQNRFKGDALVSYVKMESVELAKEILDQREIKPGFKIGIEQARFEQKGDYIPRKKIEVDKINLIKQRTDQEKLLSWNEGEDTEDKAKNI